MNFKQMMITFGFGLLIEYGVCLGISHFFNDRDHYWNAFLVMLALWAVQAALGVKNLIVGSIYYYIYGKRQLASLVEEKMVEAGLPYYDDQEIDGVDYLRRILNDPEATRDEFQFAAESVGALDYAKAHSLLQGWRLMKVLDLAVQRYLKRRGALERSRARRREPEFS